MNKNILKVGKGIAIIAILSTLWNFFLPEKILGSALEQESAEVSFPEKFMLVMDNTSGNFENESLVYNVTKNNDVVSCKTFGLRGGILGIGAKSFTADINFNLISRSGNWSVIYPKGGKLPQSGEVILIPKDFGEYDIYFKNKLGEFHGKGILKPTT